MIRINELRLPLEHPAEALPSAAAKRLGIAEAAIRKLTVFKRSHDARKKNALLFIYTVDLEIEDEAAVLTRFADDPKVEPVQITQLITSVLDAPLSLDAHGRVALADPD